MRCAHEPCPCTVEAGERFCSQTCEAQSTTEGGPEPSCDCGHRACTGEDPPLS